MKKIVLLLIILAVLGFGGWSAYQRIKSAQSPSGFRPASAVPVEIVEIHKDTIKDIGIFTGSLNARSQFIAAPKVSGWLRELLMDVGDTVTRNQVIAVLDDAEYTQQVDQAQAELNVAQANAKNSASDYELALREYDRVKALREKKIASDSELDSAQASFNSARTQLDVSDAQIKQKEAALEAAKLKLSYTKVRAFWETDPNKSDKSDKSDESDTRVVGERFVDVGALVQANQPIVSILQNNVLVAVVYVVEKDYPKIKIGQEAVIDTDAYPGKTFSGKIARIAPLLQETSRQARVEIEIPNPEQLLKPGMFIRARIEFADHENATLVPRSAVVRRNDTQGIFIIVKNNLKAQFVPVTVGIMNNDIAEIIEPEISGFVATLGNHLLEDGSTVILPQEKKIEKTNR